MDENELFDMEIQDPIDSGGSGCCFPLSIIISIGILVYLFIDCICYFISK
ncbi:MAG: hypothetical protein PUE08_07590 [Eubacteriales bacterium]|nr:hypothetical protein [Eubacteriales bacterium]